MITVVPSELVVRAVQTLPFEVFVSATIGRRSARPGFLLRRWVAAQRVWRKWYGLRACNVAWLVRVEHGRSREHVHIHALVGLLSGRVSWSMMYGLGKAWEVLPGRATVRVRRIEEVGGVVGYLSKCDYELAKCADLWYASESVVRFYSLGCVELE